MKREVIEWVDKAEGDFVSAQREYRARKLLETEVGEG